MQTEYCINCQLREFEDFKNTNLGKAAWVVHKVFPTSQKGLNGIYKEYDYRLQTRKPRPGEELFGVGENGDGPVFCVRYVKKQQMWVHGEENGPMIERNKDGSLAYIVLKRHGQKDGPGVRFFADGGKLYERWKNGVLIKEDADIRREWMAKKKTR